MRELWEKIAHTSGARIYAAIVGVVALFLTARLLGPEGRGQVAAITTWVGMFSTFAFLSLGQVALYRLTDDRQQNRIGSLLGSLLLMAVLLTLGGWVVAIALYKFNPEGAFKGLPLVPLILGFLSLPFLIWEHYGSSLLMGLERISIYNRYQILGRTLSVLAIFVLVGGLGFGVSGVITANFLGQIIVALGGISFLCAYAREKSFSIKPNMHEIKMLASGGAKLHLNAIGTFLFTSVNILILNYYHGAEQTGYFQLAMQLISVLTIIPQAACMILYGKVVSLGPNKAWPINRDLLWQLTLGMAVLSGFAAITAPWAIVLLAGESFRPAVSLFQWLLFGVIGMSFSTVMAPQWIGRGYLWQAALITVVIGVINLGANLLLIPKYGMQGAVYAFLGTYAFSIFSNGAMAWHCNTVFNRGKTCT